METVPMRQFAVVLYIALFMFAMQPVCLAQQEPPRKLSSDIATNAIAEFNDANRNLVEKRDSAKKRVVKTFEDEFGKLRDVLITKLQASLEAETKNGNLDAAIEIRDSVRYFEKLTPEVSIPRKVVPKTKSDVRSLREELRQLKKDLANARRNVPARFTVVQPVATAIVAQGEKIFTNRDYKWEKIPPAINGWIFTKHAIRTPKTYEIDVAEQGFVIVCYSSVGNLDNPKTFYDDGWTRVVDVKLSLDNNDPGWVVARKDFAVGRHKIPLGHPHSGTVLLSPQPNQ